MLCDREPVGFADLYRAYAACRRGKGRTRNTQAYEARLLDRLVDTRQALNSRQWRPSRTLAFAVNDSKPREIHAADFGDRVVHHWLVPRLEAWYEPVFIHDSYANRVGKGIHSAIERLRQFIRQAGLGGKRPVWYLQLDIANFFNSISRQRLLELLLARGERQWRKEKPKLHQHPKQAALRYQEINHCLWLCRTLLAQDAGNNAVERSGRVSFDRVPAQKRLKNARPGCGLPIGNLSSQLFANVMLNELDQFVKHHLKCGSYLRYMDDFILLSHRPEQLLAWRSSIEQFLQHHLGLELKELAQPARVAEGIDFLGYMLRPYYTLPRRRVVRRLERVLNQAREFHRRVGPKGMTIILHGPAKARLQAQLASYLGHLQHADSYRLVQRLWAQHGWLRAAFDLAPNHCRLFDRAQPNRVTSARSQLRHFRHRFPRFDLLMQIGYQVAFLPAGQSVPLLRELPRRRWQERGQLQTRLRLQGRPHLLITEQGYLKRGLKRRLFHSLWYPFSTNTSVSGMNFQASHGEPTCIAP